MPLNKIGNVFNIKFLTGFLTVLITESGCPLEHKPKIIGV